MASVVSPNVAGGIGLNLSVKMGQDQGYSLSLRRAHKEGKAWVYLDWQEPVEDEAVHPPGGWENSLHTVHSASPPTFSTSG
jgi:hypothetical protein